jgi:hypothetical protein
MPVEAALLRSQHEKRRQQNQRRDDAENNYRDREQVYPHGFDLLWRSQAGDRSHSLTWEPGSACRAFRRICSRTAQGGSSSASSCNRFVSSAKRSSRNSSCWRRRRSCCMALLPCSSGAGARPVSRPPTPPGRAFAGDDRQQFPKEDVPNCCEAGGMPCLQCNNSPQGGPPRLPRSFEPDGR